MKGRILSQKGDNSDTVKIDGVLLKGFRIIGSISLDDKALLNEGDSRLCCVLFQWDIIVNQFDIYSKN